MGREVQAHLQGSSAPKTQGHQVDLLDSSRPQVTVPSATLNGNGI